MVKLGRLFRREDPRVHEQFQTALRERVLPERQQQLRSELQTVEDLRQRVIAVAHTMVAANGNGSAPIHQDQAGASPTYETLRRLSERLKKSETWLETEADSDPGVQSQRLEYLTKQCRQLVEELAVIQVAAEQHESDVSEAQVAMSNRRDRFQEVEHQIGLLEKQPMTVDKNLANQRQKKMEKLVDQRGEASSKLQKRTARLHSLQQQSFEDIQLHTDGNDQDNGKVTIGTVAEELSGQIERLDPAKAPVENTRKHYADLLDEIKRALEEGNKLQKVVGSEVVDRDKLQTAVAEVASEHARAFGKLYRQASREMVPVFKAAYAHDQRAHYPTFVDRRYDELCKEYMSVGQNINMARSVSNLLPDDFQVCMDCLEALQQRWTKQLQEAQQTIRKQNQRIAQQEKGKRPVKKEGIYVPKSHTETGAHRAELLKKLELLKSLKAGVQMTYPLRAFFRVFKQRENE